MRSNELNQTFLFEEKKVEFQFIQEDNKFKFQNDNKINSIKKSKNIVNTDWNSNKFDKIILDSLMISSYNLTKGNFTESNLVEFNNSLDSEYKILNFTNKTKNINSSRQNIGEYIQGLKSFSETMELCPKSNKDQNERIIPSTPERILDAPNLIDDYYLNLLDWSVDNVLSIGLGK